MFKLAEGDYSPLQTSSSKTATHPHWRGRAGLPAATTGIAAIGNAGVIKRADAERASARLPNWAGSQSAVGG